MVDMEEPRSTPISGYLLLEDRGGLDGRCMTMPPLHSSMRTAEDASRDGKQPIRTATFTAYTPSTAENEAEDKLSALRESVSPKSQPAIFSGRRTGILRQSTSLDSTSDGSEAQQRRRTNKQVCITLPGSSMPTVSSQQHLEHQGKTALPTESSVRPREAVVEVQVHVNSSNSTRADDEEESRESAAAGLLNGGDQQSSEQEIVFLRERRDTRQRSMRRSLGQSLTDSLSRIGSRIRRGRKPPKLQRLQTTLDFDKLAENELELKANLYWHIATPIKRWKVERQVPIKLILQLLKTLVLIVQAVLFTETIVHKRGEFFFDSRIVFESVFVVDFDPESVLQQQTLYSIQDVAKELEFIATNYYRLPEVVIGGYDLERDEEGEPVPLQLSLRQYREAILNASESRFVLDGNIDNLEFNFSRTLNSNITERLFEISQDPHFHKFLELRVRLPVNVIRIEAPQQAECFRFNVQIVFVNDDNNGKILYSLGTDYSRIDNCEGEILRDKTGYKVIKGSLLVLDLIVLKFSLLSLYLTGKTLRRAYRLGKAMGQFYHHRLHLPLSWWERRSLFSKWNYVNIFSDVIITAGTVYKILLEFDVVLDASAARILLGTALLFQSAVILRYLNYFRQVNVCLHNCKI
ncbi:Mucolipin-1 [Geodia barretti]|uniref:Mucolipin-1 n=1 Tax=Geodia barretti TaxID=519541 RepID=A0AA35VUY9_GEOBA|nr:Mucolipin-1 [Geodia barretti]